MTIDGVRSTVRPGVVSHIRYTIFIMSYLFSSESVSEGHPDKVADQISDALLDQFLAYDDKSRCAIESFCTTGQVVIMGEVTSQEFWHPYLFQVPASHDWQLRGHLLD